MLIYKHFTKIQKVIYTRMKYILTFENFSDSYGDVPQFRGNPSPKERYILDKINDPENKTDNLSLEELAKLKEIEKQRKADKKK